MPKQAAGTTVEPSAGECHVNDRVDERRRAAALARDYREEENLPIAEIARRLGRAEATVKAYLYDPSDDNKGPTDSPQDRHFWALAGHARTSLCKPLLGCRCDGTRPAFPTARFVRVRKCRASLSRSPVLPLIRDSSRLAAATQMTASRG